MNDENVTSTSLDTPYFNLCLEFGETSWFVEMCGRYDNLEMWNDLCFMPSKQISSLMQRHFKVAHVVPFFMMNAWCKCHTRYTYGECEHHTPKVLNIHHQLPLFSFRFQLLARKCAPHQNFQYLAPGPQKIRWKKRFWNPFKGQKQNIPLHFRRVFFIMGVFLFSSLQVFIVCNANVFAKIWRWDVDPWNLVETDTGCSREGQAGKGVEIHPITS